MLNIDKKWLCEISHDYKSYNYLRKAPGMHKYCHNDNIIYAQDWQKLNVLV